MRPYTCAMMAHRFVNGRIRVGLMAYVCNAHSEEEAIGKALKELEESYPRDDGWTDHVAIATEIEEEE